MGSRAPSADGFGRVAIGSLVRKRTSSTQISSCRRWAAAWTSSRSRCRSAAKRRCSGVAPRSSTRTATSRSPASLATAPKRLLDAAHRELFIVDAARLDLDPRPARLVEDQPARLEHHAVLDFDEHRPFRPRLANAAALEIARIDDEGIAAQDLVSVHMAERPIMVTARREILRRCKARKCRAEACPCRKLCSTPMLNQPGTAGG